MHGNFISISNSEKKNIIRIQQSVGIIRFYTANFVEKGNFSPEPPLEARRCFHIFPKVHLLLLYWPVLGSD